MCSQRGAFCHNNPVGSLGIATGDGSPGCKALMGSMDSLTFLRSCDNLRLPNLLNKYWSVPG